jgi:pilus assembly protein Flp/PilA
MVAGFLQVVLALKRDRRGVTAIEYGLIVALVSVVIVIALTRIGGGISGTFNLISSEL